MWNWVLSVGIVVLTSTIITIIMPEGKVSGIIMVVLSIMVIFVVIKPILSLKSGDLAFNDATINQPSDYDYIDYEYVDYTNFLRAERLKNECEELLTDKGYKPLSVEIIYDDSDFRQFNLKSVKVILDKEVINSNTEHINIIDEIKDTLSNYLQIKKEYVNVS